MSSGLDVANREGRSGLWSGEQQLELLAPWGSRLLPERVLEAQDLGMLPTPSFSSMAILEWESWGVALDNIGLGVWAQLDCKNKVANKHQLNEPATSGSFSCLGPTESK